MSRAAARFRRRRWPWLVAAALLAVVIVAAGKIFQAAGTVVGVGLATADILQEAAAIERQIRGDLGRLSREGFLAIRCVAVPNDVNGSAGLLDPALEPDAVIRADQLVFFTHGAQNIDLKLDEVHILRVFLQFL